MWGEALATWATSSHGLASERRRSIIATATGYDEFLQEQRLAQSLLEGRAGATGLTSLIGPQVLQQCSSAGSDGSERPSEGRPVLPVAGSWCQGDADVKARTSHERPSRRYFFQASYSDATWHTAVGKATGTCESLGRGTGAPRGVLPLVRPICAGVSSLHAALDNLLQVL